MAVIGCEIERREPARGKRRLLLELPNRGRKLLPGQFNRARAENPPTANIPPGDGFLFCGPNGAGKTS